MDVRWRREEVPRVREQLRYGEFLIHLGSMYTKFSTRLCSKPSRSLLHSLVSVDSNTTTSTIKSQLHPNPRPCTPAHPPPTTSAKLSIVSVKPLISQLSNSTADRHLSALFWPSLPKATPTWPNSNNSTWSSTLALRPADGTLRGTLPKPQTTTNGTPKAKPCAHVIPSLTQTVTRTPLTTAHLGFLPSDQRRARSGIIPSRKFRDYPIDEEILPLLKAMAKAWRACRLCRC